MSKKKKARKKARKAGKLTVNERMTLFAHLLPHAILHTRCLECKAQMDGEWYGNPPWVLKCEVCGVSYTVTTGNEATV